MNPHLPRLLVVMTLALAPLRATTAQAQANLALATRYFTEVYGQPNLALIDDLFVADYTHVSTDGSTWTGRDRLKQTVTRVMGMLPHAKAEVLHAAADDEKVMFLIQFESDMPEFASEQAKRTHPRVTFPETFIFWVRDGKIHRGRTVGSHLELIKQASGFKGTLQEITAILSRQTGSGKRQD